ncbi:MAG: hypothetical protein K1X82_06985 [Bacteroidia bacterium]|nr:hypothetical protein [Bacteroidia bacterium]
MITYFFIIKTVQLVKLIMIRNNFLLPLSFLILISPQIISCKKEPSVNDSNGSFYGIWTRLPGPSGDRTDIAIGGIPGEAENRVYMCEKEGSLTPGFFKGTLNGDIIIWDPEYNFPNTQLRLLDGELEFSYPSLSWTIPTLYERGTWGGECGSLGSTNNNSKKLAVGINPTDPDLSYVNILGVTLDNVPIPLTLLNAVITEPNCSSNSYINLGTPQLINQYGEFYTVRVTFSAEGLNGFYTQTDVFNLQSASFTAGCNLFKVVRGPLGYTIGPI